MSRRETLSRLLSIDIDAEVRKLCAQRFPSRVDAVVDFLRTAAAHGATRISVSHKRRRLCIDISGEPLPDRLMQLLVLLATPQANRQERHKALVTLEDSPFANLLGILAESQAYLTNGQNTLAIGKPPPPRTRTTPGWSLDLQYSPTSGIKLQDLQKACRLAEVPILINGIRVSFGANLEAIPADVLIVSRFCRNGVAGIVGIPRDDEICKSVTLHQQLVHRETSGVSPHGFAHVAIAWDTKAESVDHISSQRINSVVRAVREELYHKLRNRWPTLSNCDRAVVRSHFLRLAESKGPNLLRGLEVFQRLEGEPMDYDGVRRSSEHGTVMAIDRNRRNKSIRWLADQRRIFVLDQKERNFLTKRLKLRLVEPPVQVSQGWHRYALERVEHHVRKLGTVFSRLLTTVPWYRVVPRERLSQPEMAFILAVEAELRSGRYILRDLAPGVSKRVDVEMVQSRLLPARLRGHGITQTLCFPRANRRLQRAVGAYKNDARNIYPALAALLGGYDGYGSKKLSVQARMMAGSLEPLQGEQVSL